MTGLLDPPVPAQPADPGSRPASPVPRAGSRPATGGALLRPVRPGDTAAVREFLCGLSLDTAYRRFFTGIGVPSAAMVRRLVAVGPGRSVVLAVAGDEVVGIADATVTGPTVELGVVLADAWQRRGLGTPLCAAALAPALTAGIPVLRAHALADNARVAKLIRRTWPTAKPHLEDGLYLWDLPLPAGA